MPLPGLELETSGFDIMLGFMYQPNEPKSLSDWEEMDNPLILHNNMIELFLGILLHDGTIVINNNMVQVCV